MDLLPQLIPLAVATLNLATALITGRAHRRRTQPHPPEVAGGLPATQSRPGRRRRRGPGGHARQI
ncbi:hypothetical protein [Sphaerisporangium sp. NPDC051011]|uniref:hypothetical protein n=1 Tax=Sphaerisporangium sp. NPDC051011 TaxID=3155792 RepID=UPI0033F12CCD